MSNRKSNVQFSLSMEQEQVFDAARAAVVLLKKTLDSWVAIGRAVVQAQEITTR